MAPANFAMVMGTGITAIGLSGFGWHNTARSLCLLCGFLWLANVLLLAARLLLLPRQVLQDLLLPGRSSGFLTAVAGTNVLGSGCILIFGSADAAGFLFWTGLSVWPCLAGLIWTALCVSPEKAPLEKGINGSWLLFTVSTQSVVVLASSLWGDALTPEAAFPLFIAFVLGESLYFLLIPLIVYRLMFKSLEAADLSATYWINAGAMAITCLAGAKLAPVLAHTPALADLAPLARAMAAGAWGVATFWIPCLVLLGFWRHGLKRYPLRYGVEYWSMVFPLGMYAVCTLALHALYPVPALARIAGAFVVIASAVWCTVFFAFCSFLWRAIATENRAPD